MNSTNDDAFTIDYEVESVDSDQIVMGRRVRSRVRIFVDDTCITDPNGRYAVSDFLPYNCTKLLRGVDAIADGRPHRVPFTDSVCDVYVRPESEETVLVNAYDAEDTPRNPAVPDEGLPVAKSALLEEIVESSRRVRSMLEPVDDITESEDYQEFVDALADAERAVTTKDEP